MGKTKANRFAVSQFAASTPVGGALSIAGPLTLGGPAFGISGKINLNGSTSGTATLGTGASGTSLQVGASNITFLSDGGILNSQNLGASFSGNTSTGLINLNGPTLVHGFSRNVTSQSTNYTALPVDDFIKCTGGVAFTVTLPATPQTGKEYIIKNTTSPLATITVASTANIDGAASQTLTAANQHMTVIFDGSTYNITG